MDSLVQYIIERQAINFGEANANENQCIILAGGPASGKGFVQQRILADFKTIDVDHMKELYVKYAPTIFGDNRKYDFSNSKDVADLHEIVKKLGWKAIQRRSYKKERLITKLKQLMNSNKEDEAMKLYVDNYNSTFRKSKTVTTNRNKDTRQQYDEPEKSFDLTNAEDVKFVKSNIKELIKYASNKSTKVEKLPNVCWDMVSDELSDITAISYDAKAMGYTTTLIWVVCNMETAKEGNKNRDRKVPEDLLVEKHKKVRELIPKVLKGEGKEYQEAVDSIDNAWVGLSAGYHRKLDNEMTFNTGSSQSKQSSKKSQNKPDTFASNKAIKFHKMDRKNGTGPFDYEKYEKMINTFLDMQQPKMTPEEIKEDDKQNARRSSYGKSFKGWDAKMKELAKDLSYGPDVKED